MKKAILILYDGPHKKSEDLFYISQKNLYKKMAVLNPWEY